MTYSPAASYKALSLQERLGVSPPAVVNAERGETRLRRWREQPPFAAGSFFAERLAAIGIDAERLRDLLGEEVSDEACGRLPENMAWVLALEESFAAGEAGGEKLPAPDSWRQLPAFPFYAFVEKICRRAVRRLIAELESFSETRAALGDAPPWDNDELASLVAGALPDDLLTWPLATLVLELHVARLRGELTHEDAKGRFAQFAESLAEDARVLSILEEYPVLARQLVEGADGFCRVIFELLKRLSEDWSEICRVFTADAADTLTHLYFGAGDRHAGGRAVAILGFRSGFRLVYKPRSLAVDARFQELLVLLNTWGEHPPLRTITILDRAGYGWVEHVAAEPCSSEEQVGRFYRRQGAYLAILYMLRATDIHFENVIAHGEYPILVDLESLLQPGTPHGDSFAGHFLLDSILQVGLLPVRGWAGASTAGLDVSSLGGPAGQQTPRPEPFWASRGTDEMHLDREAQTIDLEIRHRPRLLGETPPATDYAEEIVGGFCSLYRVLAEHRQELLAPGSLLRGLANLEVRVLLRPTMIYSLMLRESFHPDFLRDALDRDRFFDKLWQQVPRRRMLQKLVLAEQNALREGDIPLFRALPGSRAIWTDAGACLEDFFSKSGLEMLEARLRSFSEKDLRRQVWFVRASLAILSQANPEEEKPKSLERGGVVSWSPQSAVDLAQRVACALLEGAIEDADSVFWLGLEPAPQGAIKIARLGKGLYNGQAGVALFLAYLGAITGDNEPTRVAEKAIATLLRDLAQGNKAKINEAIANPGAFAGVAGIAYCLCHLARLWRREELETAALSLLEGLPDLVPTDQRFDVLGGSAGAILVLAGLYRQEPHDSESGKRLLALMEGCGERLLEKALVVEDGLGWLTTSDAKVPLAGFSHGNAGIAAALLELSRHSRRSEFRAAALAALRYERHLFSPEEGNWADLRREPKSFDQVHWCHGAPGIGLSRVLMLRNENEQAAREDLLQELRVAVSTTLERGFGRSHSLCHGDLGNIDFLRLASEALPELGLDQEIERLAALIVADIEARGWRSGLAMGVETPGLMVGLAGIGHGLLRLARPALVPTVLSLEMPPRV